MTMTATPQGDPATRPTLPPGALACRFDGSMVRDPDPARTETLTVYGPRTMGGAGAPSAVWEVDVTQCDDCTRRRARADALLNSYPAVRRAHGDVALDRADAALIALDILGDRRGKLAGQLVGSAQELYDMIEALAPLGGAAYWAAGRALPGAYGTRRWSHIGAEFAGQVRDEHRALLRRRFEIAGPVTPPANALPGCALCGVGSVLVPESETGSAWGMALRIPMAVFGAGGDVRTAHCCGECQVDLEAVGGAIGLPVLWRALLRFLDYAALPGRVITGISGVQPWAALPIGTAPNATRFAHVDTAGIERVLAQSSDVRKLAA